MRNVIPFVKSFDSVSLLFRFRDGDYSWSRWLEFFNVIRSDGQEEVVGFSDVPIYERRRDYEKRSANTINTFRRDKCWAVRLSNISLCSSFQDERRFNWSDSSRSWPVYEKLCETRDWTQCKSRDLRSCSCSLAKMSRWRLWHPVDNLPSALCKLRPWCCRWRTAANRLKIHLEQRNGHSTWWGGRRRTSKTRT